MSKKYLSAAAPTTIITNDLFLAAFLVSVGCTLDRIEKNERRRVSFVFVGERCRELREAYRTGPVHVDMRDFRENLNRLRDRLGETITGHYPEERSAAYATARSLDTQPRLSSYAHA
jgi:hypothetical protein